MNDKKQPPVLETAIFGGGCFWCLEAAFSKIKGVCSAVSGYAGGKKEDPTYEEVSSGKTGHAETVQITYDPSIVSYAELLNIFFSIHDPTTIDRQGSDIGPQYRSIILYSDEKQHKVADDIKMDLTEQKIFDRPIITEVSKLQKFYPAKEYHQKYFEKNPDKAYCRIIIAPKLSKLRKKYGKYYEK